jgi:galactokinase/mevalonate kinase-like predicted kinase
MNIPIFVDRHSGPVLGALIDQVNIFTITHGNDSRIIIWDTDNG